VSTWERIESTARSVELTGGLEARVADPLWMLARQWQVSEFRGDDAAQPAGVRVSRRTATLTGLSGIRGDRRALPSSVPLETVVEAAPAAGFGAAGLHAAAAASRRLIRLLVRAGLGEAVAALRAEFRIAPPDRAVGFGSAGAQAVALLVRCAIDCAALAGADQRRVQHALAATGDPAGAETIVGQWRDWYRQREGRDGDFSWNDERLEHTFGVSVGGAAAREVPVLELRAPEHDGTHLDWYTFDIAENASKAPALGGTRVLTAIPTPVRYQGMPASRWWQLEDGTVNFGDLDAGPADLARLLVAEFATVYGDDWFVVPVSVPVGSLSEVTHIEVIDNFGDRVRIGSTAAGDGRRTGGNRVWKFFELTGDAIRTDHPSPWMLVAPTLASETDGPLLEQVVLARDEGANLAWAVERLVEGPLGRAVDRAEAWQAASGKARAITPTPMGVASADAWRYRLERETPPWWVPLVAERLSPRSEQVRFRRARMRAWSSLTGPEVAGQVGPQGVFLDPRRPRWIYEEEVPRSGVRLERRWQFGRWHDGSFHVWLQRRKRAGRGERSSGVRWDLLETAREVLPPR
jgi:hypothetical protein